MAEILQSPVEVGSLSHYLRGFIKTVLYIPGGARFQPSTVAQPQLFFEDEYVYHSCFQYDFWVEVDGMDAIVKGTLVKGPYKLISKHASRTNCLNYA